MNDQPTLPELDGSLVVYELVCGASEPVSVSDLQRRTETPADDLRSRLDLLVAYGLLNRRADGYTVRCRPTESAEQWRQRAAERADRLRAAVGERIETDGAAVDAEAAYLDNDGRRYAVVDADTTTALPVLVDRIEAAPSTSAAGVVVTAAAEDANEIQRLVDDVERSDRVGLEMIDAAVVETDSGFEYRSYLEAS